MIWVEDYQQRFVNISSYDYLDWVTISDVDRNETVGAKIYLVRELDNLHSQEYCLGYVSLKEIIGEEIIEKICKGVRVHFHSLTDLIYYYLGDELDEKIPYNKNDVGFDKIHDKRIKEVKGLIGKRFIEDEE